MVIAATLVVAASCGGGDEAGAMASGELRVEDAWAEPAPASADSPIYMTIVNDANTPDTLAAVEAAGCDAVEVHTTSPGSASPTQPVESVMVIPPNASITLGPESILLLCVESVVDLREGDTLRVELSFGSGTTIGVDADVETP